jgi:hypothetical protein
MMMRTLGRGPVGVGGAAATPASGAGAVGAGPVAVASGVAAARSPPWQLSSLPLPAISLADGLTAASRSSQSGPRKNAEKPSPSRSDRLCSTVTKVRDARPCSVTARATPADGWPRRVTRPRPRATARPPATSPARAGMRWRSPVSGP